MAHYSIYIPDARGASTDHLNRVGLGELQRRQTWDWSDVLHGPDGGRGLMGTVLSQRKDSHPLCDYYPDKQKWVPGPPNPELNVPKGAYWFGFEPERPPKPTDLAHVTHYNGPEVILKDGNYWRIPETLQMSLDVGRDPETGELTKMYPDEYSDFCRKAEEYACVLYQSMMDLEMLQKIHPEIPKKETSVDFTLRDMWPYSCTALSLNYRVCDPIAGKGFLDLLDERKMALIVRATLAIPDIIHVIEKKKVTSPVSIPVGLSTEHGE